MEILRTRKIKVYKTIRDTNYLKNSRERELLKIKSHDEGVLSLIASLRLYSKEYEHSHKINFSFNQLKHTDFFNEFKFKMNKLNEFESNYARRFIFNSIKNHENSYLILSYLLRESNSNGLIEHLHNNLFENQNDVIDYPDKVMKVIDYVLSEKPKDLLSDTLCSFLLNRKNQIRLSNQFRFYE